MSGRSRAAAGLGLVAAAAAVQMVVFGISGCGGATGATGGARAATGGAAAGTGGELGATGGAATGGSPGTGGAGTGGAAAGTSSGGQGGPGGGPGATGGAGTGGAGATGGGFASGGSGGIGGQNMPAGGISGVGSGGRSGAAGGACPQGGNTGDIALPVVDSTTEKRSGFQDGTVPPFRICTTQNPNYGQPVVANGRHAMKFFWTQVGYDGTRMDRGAEACSDLEFVKDGWYGFQFYLPSPGFPTDKTEGIAQIFANGGCSSWASMLQVRNNELWIEHRGNCATPPMFEARLASAIPRNTWNSVIIHFTASQQQAGGVQVWFGSSACLDTAPIYSKTGINFGFGTWAGDQLAAGAANTIGLKFGMYNFDDANYTAGETRTIYYDNLTQLVGNPTDAWALVNPDAPAP